MVHCALCKRDYASGASLRTHRSTFHRLDKLADALQANYKSKESCAICNKEFASKESLRTHRSKFHRQSDTETEQVNVEQDSTNNEAKKDNLSHSETEDTDLEVQKGKDQNNYKELLDIHERLIRNIQSELDTFFSLID